MTSGMPPLRFVRALQLSDSLFPSGAFAYSDGLETAISNGEIRTPDELAAWLEHYRDAAFVPCDGRALLQCSRAAAAGDWGEVRAIDLELTALRPARETRASSQSVGRRVLATYTAVFAEPELQAMAALPNGNAAAVYGVVFQRLGIDAESALLAFGYGRLAGMVSAAMRLMALGQQQGQTLLARALDGLPRAVERILETQTEPLRSFAPRMDVQQMNHRDVYSRLFRS